jgi:carboxymethylenebutenolidase
MPEEQKTKPWLEIAHVLFIDIVAYSKRLIIYVVASAFCVSHAFAKPISFTEVRIPTRQSQVRLDLYQPNDGEPHPTILILYGAGGLAFDGARVRVYAQQLVSAGYIVYLAHYLDETGGFMAGPWNYRKDFNEWVEGVRYVIDWIQKQPSSSAPIGIYGYSLGGFIALEAASDNPAVGAVVDHAGGWVEGQMKPLGRMPPLLLVHGQRDHRVPYKKYVQPLFSYLQQNNIVYESRVYPKQGHKFKPAELEEVRTLAIEFFQQHLKPANRVKGSASPSATSNAQRPTSNAQ